MWEAVVTSFDAVCLWIATFIKALFVYGGALRSLLTLSVIGIAVFVFLVSMKFINSLRR